MRAVPTTRLLSCLALVTALLLLAACGSTQGNNPDTRTGPGDTATAVAPNTLPPSGTTDTGSRYAGLAEPFGAIAVESDPLTGAGPVAVTPVAVTPTPATYPPPTAPRVDDLGAPPAGTARDYRAPPPPPPPQIRDPRR